MTDRHVPLTTTMPPAEKERLKRFAARVGRPMGWVIRDAVAAYIEATDSAAGRMADALKAPKIRKSSIGRTPPAKPGPRP